VVAFKIGVLAERETAMCQDTILVVDYHDEHCVIRTMDCITGNQSLCQVATTAPSLLAVVDQATARARERGGKAVWLQESTTGWARVKRLVGDKAQFLLANVLQMPLPPKAKRRKTDKVDTARLGREYLNGQLPLAHQPDDRWRQLRRLVALRENLVSRRTALRNWIDRYLAHETWEDRRGLWSPRGLRRIKQLELPPTDRLVVDLKLEELERLAKQLQTIEQKMLEVYQDWPQAQRADAIKGIGVIAAVSILARIGPIERFGSAEQLIAFAGLAPSIRQSDETSRGGRIGGGGTDWHLRHYVIEATVWTRSLPRYRQAYQRVRQRRGNKVARIAIGRMLLRSLYKMLRDDIPFSAVCAAR
jgi:transposase